MNKHLLLLTKPTKSFILKLKDSGDFIAFFIFLVVLVVSSTFFYVRTEGWRVLDALYFVSVTITTVGYGDFSPKTDIGKLYTLFLIFSGVGTTVTFISILAKHTIDYQRESFEHMKSLLLKQKDEMDKTDNIPRA